MASRRSSNEGWRGPCEAGTSINEQFGKPLVQHCGKPGRWFAGGFLFGVVLCPEHEGVQERVKDMAMHVDAAKVEKRRKAV